MDRLPERFEKEVLEPAGIYWEYDEYVSKTTFAGIPDENRRNWKATSPYEIAARGLEAMGNYVQMMQQKPDHIAIIYGMDEVVLDRTVYKKTLSDKDFCECIFKAIREIYE